MKNKKAPMKLVKPSESDHRVRHAVRPVRGTVGGRRSPLAGGGPVGGGGGRGARMGSVELPAPAADPLATMSRARRDTRRSECQSPRLSSSSSESPSSALCHCSSSASCPRQSRPLQSAWPHPDHSSVGGCDAQPQFCHFFWRFSSRRRSLRCFCLSCPSLVRVLLAPGAVRKDRVEGPVPPVTPELPRGVPATEERSLGVRPRVSHRRAPVDRQALGLPVPGVREDQGGGVDGVLGASGGSGDLLGDLVRGHVDVPCRDEGIIRDDVVSHHVPVRVGGEAGHPLALLATSLWRWMLATLRVSRPWKGLLSWSLATRKQLTQSASLNLPPTTVRSSWPTMVPSESLMSTPTVASPRRSALTKWTCLLRIHCSGGAWSLPSWTEDPRR